LSFYLYYENKDIEFIIDYYGILSKPFISMNYIGNQTTIIFDIRSIIQIKIFNKIILGYGKY
jgi:hypothetical protein